jgi:hypothetical protein
VLRRLAVRGERAERIASFPKRRPAWLAQLARARGRGAVDRQLQEIGELEHIALLASASPAVRRRIARWAAEDRGRRPPVGGADLVAAGLRGPAVGRALRRVREAWLDRAVRSREDALALAREVARAGAGQRARR